LVNLAIERVPAPVSVWFYPFEAMREVLLSLGVPARLCLARGMDADAAPVVYAFPVLGWDGWWWSEVRLRWVESSESVLAERRAHFLHLRQHNAFGPECPIPDYWVLEDKALLEKPVTHPWPETLDWARVVLDHLGSVMEQVLLESLPPPSHASHTPGRL
jgi:hypothetical protein